MGKTSNSHFLPLQSFTKGLRIPCLIWLCTAVWGGIGAAIFFFSWEKKRLRWFRVKCTRKYIQWRSDIEVKQYTNNYHLLCTCHLPSCSVFTGEVCRPSFTDRDKERCREAKESEKWWKQNWASHAGQTDLTAQVPPLTIHCLQKSRCYSPAHFPLQPKQSAGAPRAADPPRNPAPGAVAHCSPRNAAATQPTSLGYLWDSPCSQKTSVLRLFIPPPMKQNQHILSFQRQAPFRVLQSAASLSAPSPTVRAPDWGWACSQAALNVPLCLRSPGLALTAGKPEQQWWIRVFIFEVFSKLPLHQLLNSSIQAATDTSRSLLAWGSQGGKLRLPGNRCKSSITLSWKERHKVNFSATRWVAYMFKLIF